MRYRTWEYDNAGNILSKSEYAYTTGTLGTAVDTVSYIYGNSNWGDLLTSYDGVSISYDAIGNPLTDGTWTYTWEHGRQLASMSNGSTTWSYTYDANGMRTRRTDGTTTYSYVYNGSQLVQMVYAYNSTAATFNFYYDASGAPLSVNINGTDYYYVTNLQGDDDVITAGMQGAVGGAISGAGVDTALLLVGSFGTALPVVSLAVVLTFTFGGIGNAYTTYLASGGTASDYSMWLSFWVGGIANLVSLHFSTNCVAQSVDDLFMLGNRSFTSNFVSGTVIAVSSGIATSIGMGFESKPSNDVYRVAHG